MYAALFAYIFMSLLSLNTICVSGPSNTRAIFSPTHTISKSSSDQIVALPDSVVVEFAAAAYERCASTPGSPLAVQCVKGLFEEVGGGTQFAAAAMDNGMASPASAAQSTSSSMWLRAKQMDSMQSISLWDKLPKVDHTDIELPSKIEWFACPEGSITVCSRQRPRPLINSFILSPNGEESPEQHGIAFSFFMNVETWGKPATSPHDYSAGTTHIGNGSMSAGDSSTPEYFNPIQFMYSAALAAPEVSNGRGCCAAWKNGMNMVLSSESTSTVTMGANTGVASDESDSQFSVRLWTAVTIVLLFRGPFHYALVQSIQAAYRSMILPDLEAWEESRFRNFSLGTEDHDGNTVVHNNDPNSEVFVCRLEKLVAMLCLEIPTPIPGKLEIKLNISQAFNQDISSPKGERADTTSVIFSHRAKEQLPHCNYALKGMTCKKILVFLKYIFAAFIYATVFFRSV
jgi:hypothetical protein